jgi:hypothetical protein
MISILADPDAAASKVGLIAPADAARRFLQQANGNVDEACQLAQTYIVRRKDQQRIMQAIRDAR